MTREKYAVLTMDVEAFTDTECVANAAQSVDVDLLDGFDEYTRILDRHGIKSTFFTVGELAPKLAEKMRACLARGHRVALHNYVHEAPVDIDPDEFRERTRLARERMEALLGTEVVGYRAPYFSMDDRHLAVLRELGFRYDSSRLGFSRARHTVPLALDGFERVKKNIYCRDGFYEFSMSVGRLFGAPYPVSGGGYVRLANWPFIRGVIHRYLRQNDFYVFYLHPFELTRQRLPRIKGLKGYDQYYLTRGIRSYGRHIESLIRMLKRQGYTFITFEELADKLSAEPLPAP